jgi:hypothetical protein
MTRHTLTRLAAALLALAATHAHAITWGQADGSRHPAVGALVDYDRSGTAYAFCTGTLISPTVMLTAAHCDPGVADVKVTFASHVRNEAAMVVGHYIAHPGYDQRQNDPHDIAVVVFDHPIAGVAPARLPTRGLFAGMKASGQLAGTRYTAVGYGGQERSFAGQGQPQILYEDTREWAVSAFGALNDAWLRLSQNNAVGNAGTCFGDSGGPNFLGSGSGETDIIAGTTITGDSQCVQSNVIYRLDTDAARSFLASYVTLP